MGRISNVAVEIGLDILSVVGGRLVLKIVVAAVSSAPGRVHRKPA